MLYQRLRFYSDCVSWPEDRLDALNTICDSATDIQRRTFLQHVDQESMTALERGLKYSRSPRHGLTMAQDWHVSYHRCRGVYFFRHSAIEYVFATEQMIRDLEQGE